MWTKKNLTEQQNEFNKKHGWYWQEFNKFSTTTDKIISDYLSDKKPLVSAQFPPYLSFSLTYNCNLKCKMCFQYNRIKYSDYLSIDEYIKITDEIKGWGTKPWVTLWGGEPTLHPEFEKIYRRFLDSAGLLAVCTNGTTLDEFLHLFKFKNSKTFWIISLDGLEKRHDELRGWGSFKKTSLNLEKIIKIRNDEKTNHLIGVEITITNNNLDEIPSLCSLLIKMGVDLIVINHLWYLNKEASDKYIKELNIFSEHKLNIENSSLGYVIEKQDLPAPHDVYDCIEKAESRVDGKSLLFTMPIYGLKGINNHYNFNQAWKDPFNCYKNLVKFDFDTIGNVTPCKPFPDITYGNIRNSTLLEIWNDFKRIEIVEKIITQKGFSVCNMCPDKALSLPYKD